MGCREPQISEPVHLIKGCDISTLFKQLYNVLFYDINIEFLFKKENVASEKKSYMRHNQFHLIYFF